LIVGQPRLEDFAHLLVQVDYATGELDRLRVLGPMDTKLFIGTLPVCCAAQMYFELAQLFPVGNLPREFEREHLEQMLRKFNPKVALWLSCVFSNALFHCTLCLAVPSGDSSHTYERRQ
jgi:hypothetical protein